MRDPDTAAKLTPTNQPFGCKRQVIDTDYYQACGELGLGSDSRSGLGDRRQTLSSTTAAQPWLASPQVDVSLVRCLCTVLPQPDVCLWTQTYNRDNVELVDLRRGAITAITPRGISTEQGDFDLDVLVFATGFDAMTGALRSMNIVGAGGASLDDAWSAGPRTYLGLQVRADRVPRTGRSSGGDATSESAANKKRAAGLQDCSTAAQPPHSSAAAAHHSSTKAPRSAVDT